LWFDDYVKFASEYIKREKIKRLIVMGHSMGGGVTQAIQKELGHKIKTTVLIDPLNKKAGSVDIGRVVSVAKDGNLFAKIKE
jgi:pimeloyl-ACP methyl ester carboxylesterase